MVQWLKKLHTWLFPPITEQKARKIAARASTWTPDPKCFRVYSKKPSNCKMYGAPADPCWFVYGPWDDGMDGGMLRSSRAIIISKLTGKVLYNGSAHDEGWRGSEPKLNRRKRHVQI